MNYSAIVLAAGSGSRAGLGFNKVLLEINDRKVLDYSLDVFSNDNKCNEIILVVSKSEFDYFSDEYNDIVDKFIVGGSERQYSVFNALKEVTNEYVLIHDGARPYIIKGTIQKICDILEDNLSITLGVNITDTVKEIDGDHVTKTLDRRNLIYTQTPQAFKTDLILKAHKLAKEEGFIGTDDTILIERYCNIETKVVAGDKNNIKLTTLDDVKLLEVILK